MTMETASPPTPRPDFNDIAGTGLEIAEVLLTTSPWGQPVVHVNYNGACILRLQNVKVLLDDQRRATEPNPISLVEPTTPFDVIVQSIRFNRSYRKATGQATHRTLEAIRSAVDKFFPVKPPVVIIYSDRETVTECSIKVGNVEYVIADLIRPSPVKE